MRERIHRHRGARRARRCVEARASQSKSPVTRRGLDAVPIRRAGVRVPGEQTHHASCRRGPADCQVRARATELRPPPAVRAAPRSSFANATSLPASGYPPARACERSKRKARRFLPHRSPTARAHAPRRDPPDCSVRAVPEGARACGFDRRDGCARARTRPRLALRSHPRPRPAAGSAPERRRQRHRPTPQTPSSRWDGSPGRCPRRCARKIPGDDRCARVSAAHRARERRHRARPHTPTPRTVSDVDVRRCRRRECRVRPRARLSTAAIRNRRPLHPTPGRTRDRAAEFAEDSPRDRGERNVQKCRLRGKDSCWARAGSRR